MSNIIALHQALPSNENSNVPIAPRRKNRDVRQREHLTVEEVERMIRAAKKTGRHGHRDATLILLAFRHALRVSELIELSWHQLDFEGRNKVLHVVRLKNGTPATHPLDRREVLALRELRKLYGESSRVFVTERGEALSPSLVRYLVKRAGQLARLQLDVHPHMLRHACGYFLANRGTDTRTIQAYMGHKSITHTVRYTELAPDRFRGLFD